MNLNKEKFQVNVASSLTTVPYEGNDIIRTDTKYLSYILILEKKLFSEEKKEERRKGSGNIKNIFGFINCYNEDIAKEHKKKKKKEEKASKVRNKQKIVEPNTIIKKQEENSKGRKKNNITRNKDKDTNGEEPKTVRGRKKLKLKKDEENKPKKKLKIASAVQNISDENNALISNQIEASIINNVHNDKSNIHTKNSKSIPSGVIVIKQETPRETKYSMSLRPKK
jgi:hypothetical protein